MKGKLYIEPLNIFVMIFGTQLLGMHIVCRMLLRHAATQGIYPDYNKGWLQFIGWLGIVVLALGIVLIVADRLRRKNR